MSDLIDREDVLALAKDIVVPTTDGEYRHRCIDPQEVRELPPVQPQRMHGKWLPDNTCCYETRFVCSKCGISERVPTIGFTKYKPIWNFCPNCGDGKRERGEQ